MSFFKKKQVNAKLICRASKFAGTFITTHEKLLSDLKIYQRWCGNEYHWWIITMREFARTLTWANLCGGSSRQRWVWTSGSKFRPRTSMPVWIRVTIRQLWKGAIFTPKSHEYKSTRVNYLIQLNVKHLIKLALADTILILKNREINTMFNKTVLQSVLKND
jgi:hypothetical protein